MVGLFFFGSIIVDFLFGFVGVILFVVGIFGRVVFRVGGFFIGIGFGVGCVDDLDLLSEGSGVAFDRRMRLWRLER